MASPHWSEPAGAGGRPSGLRLCTGVETRWHTGAAAGTGRPGCEQRSQEGAVRGASEHGSACGGSWVCAETGETARPVSALPPAEGGSLLCASEHGFQEPLGWRGSLNPGVVTWSEENGSIPSSPATPHPSQLTCFKCSFSSLCESACGQEAEPLSLPSQQHLSGRK